MTDEDALKFIIRCLRTGEPSCFRKYGYEVYLPDIMLSYLEAESGSRPRYEYGTPEMRRVAPHFYAAAWELCRRGILRPGVVTIMEQATPDGSAGNGYSITPFGRTWLAESKRDDFVPTEPERFGKLLEPFRARFGPGFHQRAQEAVRCYGAHAYLAACAMCGAAAESILLAIATKLKSEDEVLGIYRTASGRKRVENLVIGKASAHMQREFLGFTTLVNYWRDEAGHGTASPISDDQALTSIALLLRFAHFVGDHWDELTRS
jgi:hypothetical protein